MFGLAPSATDDEIRAAYRRFAARLSTGKLAEAKELRRLNMAYGILGSPARRQEYDRALAGVSESARSGPWGSRPGQQSAASPVKPTFPPRLDRRRHPRRSVSSPGLGELLAFVAVMGLTMAVAVVLVQRVEVDLSPVTAVGKALGLGAAQRRLPVEPPSPTPASLPAVAARPSSELVTPTPSTAPLADQFKETAVTVSDARPPRNGPLTVVAKLRRNGQPAVGVDVWLTAQYRTLRERWPQVGSVKTDAAGTAAITFNIGDATPGYDVRVDVFAQVDGQQVSWPARFTPR